MPFLINTNSLLCVCLLIAASLSLACEHQTPATNHVSTSSPNAININTATLDDLQRIPHVGEKVAAKIIEYREVNGPFRRVEHLMLIQGISDTRFRKIRPLVRVE